MQLQGAIALVTGANGGIGQYYIQGLQAAGATRIYAGARNPDSLREIAATDPDRIIPIPLDITDESSVRAAALPSSTGQTQTVEPARGTRQAGLPAQTTRAATLRSRALSAHSTPSAFEQWQH